MDRPGLGSIVSTVSEHFLFTNQLTLTTITVIAHVFLVAKLLHYTFTAGLLVIGIPLILSLLHQESVCMCSVNVQTFVVTIFFGLNFRGD